MLQGEHSAILLTFIKLPFVILRSLFCLFLSGHFTPVLLYCVFIDDSDDFYEEFDKDKRKINKQKKDKDSMSDLQDQLSFNAGQKYC